MVSTPSVTVCSVRGSAGAASPSSAGAQAAGARADRVAMAITPSRAIHLSGGVLVSGSPRSVRRLALQAGRSPAAQRARERRRRWPLGGDEFAVADRFVIDGELE